MWYFLPEEFTDPDAARELLCIHGILAMDIVRPITPKKQVRGVAFETRDGDGVSIVSVLTILDLGNLDVRLIEMEPGFQRIAEQRKRRKRAGDDDVAENARGGREAFVEDLRAAEERERRDAEDAIPLLADAADDAASAYVRAYRRFHTAIMEADVRATLAEQEADRLTHEYDAIVADARVAALQTVSDGTIVITTTSIILACEPPRWLDAFELRIGISDGSFRVIASKKRGALPHPNASPSGIPFLGALRDALIRRLTAGEYATCVRMLLDFLEEPPAAIRNPAQALEQWPEVRKPEKQQRKGSAAQAA